MHGLLTFVLIPSNQIKPPPVKETVVSFELTDGCVDGDRELPKSELCVSPSPFRSTSKLTSTTTPQTTPMYPVESWACPSRKEISSTSSVSRIQTGGRRTETETRTINHLQDWFQVLLRLARWILCGSGSFLDLVVSVCS